MNGLGHREVRFADRQVDYRFALGFEGIGLLDQFHDMKGLNNIAETGLLQFFTIVRERHEQVARFVETPRDSFIG